MRVVLALSSVVMLTSCASVAMQQGSNDTLMVCDQSKVDRTEQAARLTHVQLRWVRCPMTPRDQMPKEPAPKEIESMMGAVPGPAYNG